MPLIRDIMSKIVVSIRPDATMTDAVKVLTKHHLSGAPVVSARRRDVIGFISEPNLMDVLFDKDSRTRKVSDYMSREVQMVHVSDSIATAATMFAMYGIPPASRCRKWPPDRRRHPPRPACLFAASAPKHLPSR